MPEEKGYECPECGAPITTKMSSCPTCGIELEWEQDGTKPQEELEIHEEDLATTPEEPPPTPAKGPKLYGGLSIIGLVFAILTVVAIIGTVVLLNYDTWIDGADENNIGDTQIMYVYGAVAGIVVCALIVVFDFMKNRKAA